jgi:hypothetical protein
MTPRTKWFLIAGLVVFGLYGGDSVYRSWIEEPTQQLNARLDSVTRNIADSKGDQLVAQKLGKRLDGYAARALPYDPQLARSLYQEWLLDLVERHQFASTAVDAAQPVAIEVRSRTKKGKRILVGHRIAYSLRGQASLAKLAAFLNDFRFAGHLHKIRSVSLNPIGNAGQLDTSLAIEVLCLETSSNKDQLSDLELVQDSESPTHDYSDLVKRNLFARGFAKALNDIELKAITFNREGKAEAWFKIDRVGTIKTITAGNQVPVALHDIAVVEVLTDKVLVRVNQDPHWITLGQSIGEVCAPPFDEKPVSEKPVNKNLGVKL